MEFHHGVSGQQYGNMWEWVQDWYVETYYSSSPSTDPREPTEGSDRVVRGGSFTRNAKVVRAAVRYDVVPATAPPPGAFALPGQFPDYPLRFYPIALFPITPRREFSYGWNEVFGVR